MNARQRRRARRLKRQRRQLKKKFGTTYMPVTRGGRIAPSPLWGARGEPRMIWKPINKQAASLGGGILLVTAGKKEKTKRNPKH